MREPWRHSRYKLPRSGTPVSVTAVATWTPSPMRPRPITRSCSKSRLPNDLSFRSHGLGVDVQGDARPCTHRACDVCFDAFTPLVARAADHQWHDSRRFPCRPPVRFGKAPESDVRGLLSAGRTRRGHRRRSIRNRRGRRSHRVLPQAYHGRGWSCARVSDRDLLRVRDCLFTWARFPHGDGRLDRGRCFRGSLCHRWVQDPRRWSCRFATGAT